MALVFISEDVNAEFLKELENCGHNVIKISKHKKLYTAIESHPDIVVCSVYDKLFIEESTYNDLLRRYPRLDDSLSGIELVITQSIENGKYPSNVGLNLAYTGKYAIHNFKYTDKKLISALYDYEIEMINVKQGYSKCSILIVDESSIITADKGIYDMVKDKIECLLISEGSIVLKDMDYGFIGGASGKYRDEIWFYGDISVHPDYDSIYKFITSRGYKIKKFSHFPLEDVGTVIFVDL